jgi:hypothetical protein
VLVKKASPIVLELVVVLELGFFSSLLAFPMLA